MKKWIEFGIVVAILLAIAFAFTGCKKEKKINGVICRKSGSYWIPIANFCVNCKEYQLSRYCCDCGTKQSLVIGKSKCIKCDYLYYVHGADKYCRNCGGGTQEIVLVKR